MPQVPALSQLFYRAVACAGTACATAFNTATGYDYNGNDLPGSPFNYPTADSCEAACYALTTCKAFTWIGPGGEPFLHGQ